MVSFSFQPDLVQYRGKRKIQLSYLLYSLFEQELFPVPRFVLEIGPSGSGFGGVVLRQFGVSGITAVEEHSPFVSQLQACNRAGCSNGNPIYGNIVRGRIEEAGVLLPDRKFDFLVGFNVQGKAISWSKLNAILPQVLHPGSGVLITSPDQEHLMLRDQVAVIKEDTLDEAVKDMELPLATTLGMTRCRFGYEFPRDFYERSDPFDKFIFAGRFNP